MGRAGKPKFPEWLPEACRPLWNDILKQLSRRRTLTPGDGIHVGLYCRTHLQWQGACAEVEKHGVMATTTRFSREGNPYDVREENPAVKIAAKLYGELKDALREMGLTGLTRDKVPSLPPREKEAAEIPGTVGYYRKHGPPQDSPELDLPDVVDVPEEASQTEESTDAITTDEPSV